MSTEVIVVKRNSQGLVDALFDSIDRLNKKEIDSETARAISHTAKTIVNVARLELDFRRMSSEGVLSGNLKTLSIENAKIEKPESKKP